MVCYNPLDKFYKSQIGAVHQGEELKFRVKGNFDSVLLLIKKDGEIRDHWFELKNCGDYFEVSVNLEIGLYFYCFQLPFNQFIGINKDYLGEVTSTPERFQLTVFSNDYCVPNSLFGGIIYQIFPDRFCSSGEKRVLPQNKVMHENWNDTPIFLPNENGQVMNNDFFGGDIKGVISKLGYLKDLGVTIIYLNPIFKAFSNHRYDTGDYMQIDELLGNEDDLVELINKAKELNIGIVLDGVFNHTGDDSLYFNKYGNYKTIGAYQSKDSKYYNWFNFNDFPNEYESWWGIKTLPAINESDDGYINFITGKDGVLEHYTKLGIAGWRLDVVDELPGAFVKKIRSAVKGVNDDAIIIGEVWEDASNKVAYSVRREYFQGKELDSVMNYPLKNAILNFVKTQNVAELLHTIMTQIDHYPKDVLHSLMNILSTHDTYRLITAVGGEEFGFNDKVRMSNTFIPEKDMEKATFRVKAASLLQYTLCGVPSVYYGDEIGMEGYSDPLNRKCYPWGEERHDLLSWYQKIGNIRRSYSAFSKGDFNLIYSNNGVLIFSRTDENSEVLVAINLSEKDFIFSFSGALKELLIEKEVFDKYVLESKSLAVFVKEL